MAIPYSIAQFTADPNLFGTYGNPADDDYRSNVAYQQYLNDFNNGLSLPGGTAEPSEMDMISDFINQQLTQGQQAFAPYTGMGTDALSGMSNAFTPQGLDERLSQIMGSQYFGDLVQERERAVKGMLGAGGLTRSGTALTEAAKIPTDLAMSIDNQLFNRGLQGAELASPFAMGSGLNPAQGLEGMLTIQDILYQLEAADKSAKADKKSSSSDLMGSVIGSILKLSDPELKENARKIGEYGGLNVYEWDWTEESELEGKYPNVGFMADEVEAVYPQHVHKFGGFKAVDYSGVIGEIDE